ncbi:MAG: DUF362 domain-containing protein [Bacillota bacterium]
MGKKAIVAVVKTKPRTVVEDTIKCMEMAGFCDILPKDAPVILKNNISWHFPYPGANTTPWQLEAAVKALQSNNYRAVCVENRTVVTNPYKGERLNKYVDVLKRYGVETKYNFKSRDMHWVTYKPKAEMLVLDKIFPHGIKVPDFFCGKSILHLPTTKCHIYTQTTGSMKNAFGGLLNTKRHYCHSCIHETLVDLLAIQKEIHPGIFTVMDGTTAGNGPGPRTMLPVCKDYMLASADSAAIDAIAAKMMGFDPMSLPFIRIAHERGLGIGDPAEIEVAGEDISGVDYGFTVGDNFASSVGDLLWFGPLKYLQRLFFHTPLVNIFIFASYFYHDMFWYPVKGKRIVDQWRRHTSWGELFESYK